MMNGLVGFVTEHRFAVLSVVAAVAMFVGCLLALPVIVARLPADALQRATRGTHRWPDDGRGWIRLILRNVIGWILVAAGIAMLVLPGQGVITLVAGLAICDFPGKRRLLCAILRRPTLQRGLNRLRAHRDLPPFASPEADGGCG